MHLLKHPRNAALLGLIFVAIGLIYLIVPNVLGVNDAERRRELPGRGRRRDDAARARHRDVDHGLRPGRGDPRRMTVRAAICAAATV